MKTQKLILFLDVDGVLHLPGQDLPLARIPTVEKFLNSHPEVSIVFSTSWRESMSLEDLKSMFSPNCHHHFIGVTPVIEPPSFLNEDGELVRDERGIRQKEIEMWVEKHAPNSNWIAIDDALDLFEDAEKVLLTPKAWDENVSEELEHWIRSVLGKPVFIPR